MKTLRDKLIHCGHAEGISYLVLLFIAMPLKYLADIPLAVRIVGSLHGMLFVAFVALLWTAKKNLPLTYPITLKAFILSLLPFGTFYLPKLIPGTPKI